MIVDRTTDLSKHGSFISNDEDEISTPSGSHILFWAKINNIRDNTESNLRQDGSRTELELMHRLIIMKPDRGLNMHVNQYRTQVQSWQNHGYIYNSNEAKTYTLKAKKKFYVGQYIDPNNSYVLWPHRTSWGCRDPREIKTGAM